MVVLLTVFATLRPSAWAGDLVGGDLTLYRTEDDQSLPAIAYNPAHNEFLVVFENLTSSAADSIRAVRLSATGAPLADFVVAGGDGFNRYRPDVAYDPVEDRYMVVYSKEYSSTDYDIFGRFIPWNGPDSNLFEFMIGGSSDDETMPRVAYGQGGTPGEQYLVVWTTSSGSDWFIRGAFVQGNGSGVGTPWRISPPSRLFDWPSLAYLGSRNQFLVAAVDNYLAGDEDIAAVILDTNGNPVNGGWFTIGSATEDDFLPDVAACSSADQYLLVYDRSMTSFDLKAQFVTGAGALDGAEFDLEASPYVAAFSTVACLDTSPGVYLVAWTHRIGAGTAPDGVSARTVGTKGSLGSVFEIIAPSIADADRRFPDLAAGSPTFFAVWSHDRDTGSSSDLHGTPVMPVVFLDGFERGDTAGWSSHTP